jgi:hypothetical protein
MRFSTISHFYPISTLEEFVVDFYRGVGYRGANFFLFHFYMGKVGVIVQSAQNALSASNLAVIMPHYHLSVLGAKNTTIVITA